MLVVLVSAAIGVLAGWGCWVVARRLVDEERVRALSPDGPGVLSAVTGGALLAMAAHRSGGSIFAVVTVAILAAPLLITLLTDIQSRLVFPVVLIPGILAALGIAVARPDGVMTALATGGIAAAITTLLVVLSRWVWPGDEAPLGSGDILISTAIGVAFGPEHTPRVLLAGIVLAAFAATALLLTHRAERHSVIPYGAFLCLAALAGLALTGGT